MFAVRVKTGHCICTCTGIQNYNNDVTIVALSIRIVAMIFSFFIFMNCTLLDLRI